MHVTNPFVVPSPQAHILHGRLNYVLAYYTTYVDTTQALMLRDETINILRMAVEQAQ